MAEPDAPIAYLKLPKLHVTYFTFGEIPRFPSCRRKFLYLEPTRRPIRIVNLSRAGMLPRSVGPWFGAGKSLARL